MGGSSIGRAFKVKEEEGLGMDEKSSERSHDYVSVLTDTDGARVL